MEARQEASLASQVRLQQKFWITEDSKAKLLMAGAKCLDAVIQSEHYYDTESDELAMAELWLSQRNQQWCLIVASQNQTTKGDIIKADPKRWELPCQSSGDNATNTRSTIDKGVDKESTEPELLNHQNNHRHGFNESRAHTEVNSTYTELVRESDIMTYLADFLNIDLEAEEGGSMEDFLQRAGIQHYASNHTVPQITYLLSNRYTVIIERDQYSSQESATVLLDVDICNICKGLEEIEKLGNYLGFTQFLPSKTR